MSGDRARETFVTLARATAGSGFERLESRVLLSHVGGGDEGPWPIIEFPVSSDGVAGVGGGGVGDNAGDPGSITGRVWLDSNNNGERNSLEGGLFNQVVYIDADDDGERDNGETATRTDADGNYAFTDLDAGTYVIRQERWDELEVSRPSSDRYEVDLEENGSSENRDFGNVLTDPVEVTLMLIYTPNARRGAGGERDITRELRASVADTNSAFVNSEINVHLDLVYLEEVDYRDSRDAILDLTSLRRIGDGVLDEVHTLRDEHEADLVTLITEKDDFGIGGVAYLPQPLSGVSDTLGFGVVLRRFADAPDYVLAHELGHNFGAGHDRANPSPNGTFDYSHGFRFEADGQMYHDIMSYPEAEQILLPVFSNPEVRYLGERTGQRENAQDNNGNESSADNARTINELAVLLASYRGEPFVAAGPGDSAGNTRGEALDIGDVAAGEKLDVTEFVADFDVLDVYRFEVTETVEVKLRLSDMSRNVDLQLLDRRANVIESSRTKGKKDEKINQELEPGTYYARVIAGDIPGTEYRLRVIGEGGVESSGRKVAARSSTRRASVVRASLFSSMLDRERDEELLEELLA